MAITHVTEAEAAKDLAAILARVRVGKEVRIRSGFDTFAVIPADLAPVRPRLLSEIIAALEQRASTATLDAGFGDDVEDGIRSHQHERVIDPNVRHFRLIPGLDVISF